MLGPFCIYVRPGPIASEIMPWRDRALSARWPPSPRVASPSSHARVEGREAAGCLKRVR